MFYIKILFDIRNSPMRIASDVGGTFTDNIAYDEATQRITVSKVSTTPQNRALGTIEGLKRALALQGKTGVDVEYVGHGMTTATNAVNIVLTLWGQLKVNYKRHLLHINATREAGVSGTRDD